MQITFAPATDCALGSLCILIYNADDIKNDLGAILSYPSEPHLYTQERKVYQK